MAEVLAFDTGNHSGEVSRSGACAQGGRDTCHDPAEFSVKRDGFNMSACAKHLAGAVRTAEGMPSRKYS